MFSSETSTNTMKVNKQKKKQPKNRKTKSIIVFDEKSRVEFLTGFGKRKKERQKRAQEEIGNKIKEERRLLKAKKREFNPGVSNKKYQSAPTEVEGLAEQQVTELPEHTVTITDVSDIDLAGQGGFRLGLNKFKEEEEIDAVGSDEDESQIPESGSQISHQQQLQILRKIEAKIDKRQKHFKMKAQPICYKGRTKSKKKKHLKKQGLDK